MLVKMRKLWEERHEHSKAGYGHPSGTVATGSMK